MESRFTAGVVLGAVAYALLAEFFRQFSARLVIAEATDLCRQSWAT
ncbi:hypothetical protein SNOUR_25230 [Streptomyces noursei ATCC 11455]|nr:hypothetical protein SNOUR_25230 [Streptomyces noursei ATCC 11455]